MKPPKHVFGVIVLYHPPDDLETNIRSYLPWLDGLMVIDNTTPTVLDDWKRVLPDQKITWLSNPDNEGIAKPWNKAAKWAHEAGGDYLLTMDQDSFFPAGNFTKLIGFLEGNTAVARGIICPTRVTDTFKQQRGLPEISSVRFTMGSGSLVNLHAYKHCGSFDESLFLDLVDHEYCLRLRRKGYTINQVNQVFMNHQLGAPIRFRGKAIAVSHPPIRKYYMTRNRIRVSLRYLVFDPGYFLFEVKNTLIDFVKIIFLERDKASKARYALMGVWHSVINRYGKIGN